MCTPRFRHGRALAFLVALLLVPAAPAQTPLAACADRPAPLAGEVVAVPVRIGTPSAPVPRLLGVGLQVHFDPAAFEYAGYSRGALFADAIENGDALEFGPRRVRPADDLDRDGMPDGQSYVAYSVTRTGTEGATAAGEVVLLRFRARADAPEGRYRLGIRDEAASRGPDGAPVPLVAIPVDLDIDRSGTRRAALTTFDPGDPPPRVFPALDGLRLDVAPLADPLGVIVRRSTDTPPGAPLADGYRSAEGGAWELAPCAPALPAVDVCLPLGRLPTELRDPDALRVAFRAPGAEPWTILPTRFEDGGEPFACAAAPGPGAFTVGSTGGVLPVELARFDALADGDGVRLRWETLGETNNAGWHVEARGPGNEVREERPSRSSHPGPHEGGWREVAFEPGAGTTTERHAYAHRVGALAPGRHAFRLRQVDFDGTATVSAEVEALVEGGGALRLRLAGPNPARAHLAFEVTVPSPQRVTVAVYDALGRRVAAAFDGFVEGPNAVRVEVDAGGLAPGPYVVVARGERTRAAVAVTVAR